MTQPPQPTPSITHPVRSRSRKVPLLVAAAVVVVVAGLAVSWFMWIRPGSPSSALPDKPRVAEVARELGCTDVEIADTTRMFARESGSCTWSGSHVGIEVFATDDNRDRYVEVGSQFGGNFAAGHNWLVFADSPDVVAAAAAKLGGKVL